MMRLFYSMGLAAVLATISPSAGAYQITLHPAAGVHDSNPAVLDQNLGFPSRNLVVEVFEDEALIPQIKANVKGQVSEDGNPQAGAWDGQGASAPAATDVMFTLELPKVRVFGVGISGNHPRGDEEVSINFGRPIRLKEFPGHTISEGRAYYLKIAAETNDLNIQSVRVFNAVNLRFDHLVLLEERESEVSGQKSEIGGAATASQAPVGDQKSEDGGQTSDSQTVGQSDSQTVGQLDGRTVGQLEGQTVGPGLVHISPPEPEVWNRGVALFGRRGRTIIGDQLRFFFVDPDGVVTSSKPQWITLYHTEGKPFRLHGEVWLNGASDALLFPEDLPDGFALFLREWDSLHRYGLTSQGVEVNRRLHQGKPAIDKVKVSKFNDPEMGKWIPFYVDASWDRIVFFFGDQAAVIDGTLDVDGANKIAIAPGTKLRGVRLEMFGQ